jgi:hypothetical protein
MSFRPRSRTCTPIPSLPSLFSFKSPVSLSIPSGARNIDFIYNAPLPVNIKVERHNQSSFNYQTIPIIKNQNTKIEFEKEALKVAERMDLNQLKRLQSDQKMKKRLASSQQKKRDAFRIVLDNVACILL